MHRQAPLIICFSCDRPAGPLWQRRTAGGQLRRPAPVSGGRRCHKPRGELGTEEPPRRQGIVDDISLLRRANAFLLRPVRENTPPFANVTRATLSQSRIGYYNTSLMSGDDPTPRG